MFSGFSLKDFNTFALPAYAKNLVVACSIKQLVDSWHKAKCMHQPYLILGAGSNVLFIEDFQGTIVLNRIKMVDGIETPDSWCLHVGAGENWHDLVCYALRNNMPGLENLALIPGCVGSAPIQNIGAYGVELQKFCDYVDVVNLESGLVQRFTSEQCQFGYRDSIFRHRYSQGYAIIAVGLKLSKKWLPVLDYGDLSRLDSSKVTPQQVFDTVCAMRLGKLPDPAITGNAGSFFKNPVVQTEKAREIFSQYPDAPRYPQSNNRVKLAAGWLIEQCALKGYQMGAAAVHQNQALVIINQKNASGKDIINLARYIRNQVAVKFGIWLEPEVRLIAARGEISAIEVFE